MVAKGARAMRRGKLRLMEDGRAAQQERAGIGCRVSTTVVESQSERALACRGKYVCAWICRVGTCTYCT